METLLAELIHSITVMPGQFATVAANDPVAAVLVAVGTVLVAFSICVLGYLTLGALVDLVIPDSTGRAPPQATR